MNVDKRGRCRFGHKGFRAEVGQSGSVNITERSHIGEEHVWVYEYKNLMSDPEFIAKLFEAQTEVRRAALRTRVLAQWQLAVMR